MKLELTVFNCMCEPKVFIINGVNANEDDFGIMYDSHPEMMPSFHGCGYMKFERIPSEDEVLKKYHISEDEYDKICDELEQKLTFGTCSWCE